jgi:hypothetical protein
MEKKEMKTTEEMLAALRMRLKREPTIEEVETERIRLGQQWYESLRLTMETIGETK